MSRLVVSRGELERIASSLAAAKYVLEGQLLFSLVTHPIRNALIELEVISLIGDVDKLLRACHVANDNYFHGEAAIDASHERTLAIIAQVERNVGRGLGIIGSATMASALAVAGIGGSSAGSAKLIDSFNQRNTKSSIANLVSRLHLTSIAKNAQVRIETKLLGGYRQFTVFIPGTQNWSPFAGKNPLDLNASLRALAQDRGTAAANSVRAAMLLAGIGKQGGDRVTLIGHSLGGLIATQIAKQAHVEKLFRVSGVLTVGAPASASEVNGKIPVLNLEHTDDPVVYADLSANTDTQKHLTFVADSPQLRLENHPLFGAHDLSTYQSTAVAAQNTADPLLQPIIQELELASGTGEVKVQLFELERVNQ